MKPITKRRIALLRSFGRTADAVVHLNAYLEFSPTDSEAWSELADIYLIEGMYSQAIFALEEVLVLAPNAWNVCLYQYPRKCNTVSYADFDGTKMHARLGEVLYMAAATSQAAEHVCLKHLAEAVKRFSRSIELCDNYLRGYYGLKLVGYLRNST